MEINTGAGLLIFVLFLLPGVVHSVVYERLRGPVPNLDFSVKTVRWLTASIFFAGLYLVLLSKPILSVVSNYMLARRSDEEVWKNAPKGTPVVQLPNYPGEGFIQNHIGQVALVAFFLLFGVPAFTGWFRFKVITREFAANFDWWNPHPTRWDELFAKAKVRWPDGYWVRVQTKDGQWFGGAIGSDGGATDWPAPPELLISRPIPMKVDGTWDVEPPRTPSRRVWLPCQEARVVQVIGPRSLGNDQPP